MTSFAQGTPPEVIAAVEKKLLSGQSQKPKVGQTMIPYTADKPVRPDEPKTVQSPRQTFNQQREAAQVARQTAYRAAMQMQDVAKRQEAKAAARSAYKNAVDQARDAFNIAKAGPRTGGNMLPPGGMKAGGKVKKMAVAPIAPKQYDETTMSKSDVGKLVDQQRAMAAAKYPTQPSRFPTMEPASSTSAPKLKPTLMKKPTAPARGPRPIPAMKSGGSVSASKRADGCAIKGKTRGRIV